MRVLGEQILFYFLIGFCFFQIFLIMPEINFRNVDFPQPDLPMIAVMEPDFISRDMPFSTSCFPYENFTEFVESGFFFRLDFFKNFSNFIVLKLSGCDF
jgi:hypothetical protein